MDISIIDAASFQKMSETEAETRRAKNSARLSCDFTVKFDREVDKEKHYISPGTIQISFWDGTVIPFDFINSASSINGNKVEFEESGLDIDVFPSSAILKDYLRIEHIANVEIYIYTGEENEDAPINPVKLCEFRLYDSVEELEFVADERFLAQAVLCNN